MASDTLSWAHHFGSDENSQNNFEGVLNTTVANEGSSAALVTDRYNSGDGQKMEGSSKWLDTHGDHLVLHLAGDDASGVGETGDSLEFYGASGSPAHDDLFADGGYTTLSGTTVKAVPTRVVFSVSNPGEVAPYIALAIASDESVEAWARNGSGTQFGPAGGDSALSPGWHAIGFGYNGTNLFVTVNSVKESTTVNVSGNFDNLAETTIGALRTTQAQHFVGLGASIDVGRTVVWDRELDQTDRDAAHNKLAETYTSLSTV